MKNKTVYVLMASSGSYDDYIAWVVGVYATKELAEKAKEEHDKKHIINESDLIMPKKVWEKLGFGYGEDGNILIDKGGYTAKQFETMNEQMNLLWEDIHPCRIEKHELIIE